MNKIETTISGSLPKPNWIASTGKLWSPWKLSADALELGKLSATQSAVQDQLKAGLSIITDGEQSRQHFVTTFIENLSGVNFKKRKIVRIRDRYDASVPTVVGPVSRKKPVFIKFAKFLRNLSSKPIKFSLPGPMTMVDTLYDNFYKSREKLAWRFAEVLNEEAKELEKAGVDYIQFDEPAFNVFFDEVRDWGIETLERAAKNLRSKTVVHICYGYGIKANNDWKKTLGSEWRQYEKIFPLLNKSKIDQISLECMNSKVPLDLLSLLKNKKILAGVIDVATNKVETPKKIFELIKKITHFVKPKQLSCCTNCGMITLPPKIAQRKMESMVQGAKLAERYLF
ncbi:MAG: methionine synthase [Pelagibacteraceae bacterium]|jgi:5-methyltetrahydropteroyltriglutamate--homocysteine methyltransferase